MAKRTLADFRQSHDPQLRIGQLEAELKKATAESADARALKEIIGTAIAQLDKLALPAWTTAPLKKPGAPGVPTLFLSDLHWGEVVHAGQIGGVNSFNLAIAQKRLKHTIDTAIYLLKILDPTMSYPGLVVALGGDMISGNIHEELQATNEINTMPTVLDLYDHLSAALLTLKAQFPAIFVVGVSGNHGRDTRKVWAKDRHHTSFDWLLYQFLARRFKDHGGFSFHIPDSSDALFRIYGTRYALTHGDQFRAGDSIIGPIGPLTRGNQKKLARNTAVGQDYDVMLAAHWHQYIHLEHMIVNGSLKGYDEYAYQNNFAFEPPRQALWLTHPRFGITYRMPVLCEQPVKGPTTPWVQPR